MSKKDQLRDAITDAIDRAIEGGVSVQVIAADVEYLLRQHEEDR